MRPRLRIGAVAVVAVLFGALAGSADTPSGSAANERSLSCVSAQSRDLGTREDCEVRVGPGRARFTALTMFGDEHLGNCPFRFRLYAGSKGRLEIDRIAVLDSASGGCGDFLACRRSPTAPESAPTLPWRGQVARTASARYEARIQMCFDTCLGRFEGQARLRLEPRGKGAWLLRASGAPIGRSGLEIAGQWTLRQRAGAPGSAGELAPAASRSTWPPPSAGTVKTARSSE